MRVLFLAHRVPYPPNRGDRIRSFHWLEYLSRRAEVHLAFLAEQEPPEESIDALEAMCARVAAVRLGKAARWLRGARSLAAGRTATEGLFHSPALKRIVCRWAAQTRFDLVVAFCSSMVQYLDAEALAGVPAVVDLVDVDSQKWLDYAAQSRGPARWLLRLEGRRLRRLECGVSGRAQAIILVSGHEAKLYRSFSPAECVYAIGNGVDLEYFRPKEPAEGERPAQCVFVGAMDYRANVDGVTWLAREVWPEVYARRPAARLVLVGSNPGAGVKRLAELPGVELVGEVPDVRPHLSQAAVVVVPLRVARGIQNKVLEALAMGKAVIASPQALEGLEVEPGVHVCRAASPAEWIEGLLALLDDPDLCRRLGLAGRQRVEQSYTWTARLAPLADLLRLASADPAGADCRADELPTAHAAPETDAHTHVRL